MYRKIIYYTTIFGLFILLLGSRPLFAQTSQQVLDYYIPTNAYNLETKKWDLGVYPGWMAKELNYYAEFPSIAPTYPFDYDSCTITFTNLKLYLNILSQPGNPLEINLTGNPKASVKCKDVTAEDKTSELTALEYKNCGFDGLELSLDASKGNYFLRAPIYTGAAGPGSNVTCTARSKDKPAIGYWPTDAEGFYSYRIDITLPGISGGGKQGTYTQNQTIISDQITFNEPTTGINGFADWILIPYSPPESAIDTDNDVVPDSKDNCITKSNSDQSNSDGDSKGNACDNCIFVANNDQKDSDKDGKGDACDNLSAAVETGPTVYRQWRPQASLIPGKPGNSLLFYVYFVTSSEEDVADVTITLICSKERGICTNWPPNSTDNSPDLKLAHPLDGGFTPPAGTTYVLSPNRDELKITGLKSYEKKVEAPFLVQSYDYGAYGHIVVEVKVVGPSNSKDLGNSDRASLIGFEFENNAIDIPLDKNNNLMADGWEEAMGLSTDPAFSLAWNWDYEGVQGQTSPGDGLTAYDEYRGFVTNVTENKIVWRQSTDPYKTKDLFVYDPFQLANYFGYHSDENPAKINVQPILNSLAMNGSAMVQTPLQIKQCTLGAVWVCNKVVSHDDLRWINSNSSSPRQHALHVTKDVAAFKAIFFDGWNEPSPSLATKLKEKQRNALNPRVVDYVNISTFLTKADFKQNLKKQFEKKMPGVPPEAILANILKEKNKFLVKHELGHAIGEPHHHDYNPTPPEDRLGLGDDTCAMRVPPPSQEFQYNEIAASQATGADISQLFTYGDLNQYSQNPTESGNGKSCFEQIRIKDWSDAELQQIIGP
ncbi:MAG: hypothetical protein A3F82_01840 [Deltaproteobacteria bacterium RIFCSPLOWO2_12_FULL_44_12]|nr:MAG: hypothetical protein A2712_03115 [Deltaproteobacteria bacterium RIFCSPHIGHO2_01_FULL_43_49]OGQ16185.1 MAG: hypothetical protein A3D22_01085 [Deltaproteobacteria bacterium RIFCSPHIGHO2_02_FULL_44_53]OGQ29146.1 MAG: hypothetical protein A3D98_04870 [Deltaproteobacteria bacterium RIFCSPHIGHO2_12_FULL_44_21]OGQ32702.1 MAG: hypothetical protein A2979_09015 [Deltaproteobacteria bacterium RIFCSPLOWO2_01_FULL_45_74]OGQ41804.1 MAG: hypothetical protein A3I70_08800 [Deltaproteobacteria bacterium 